MFCMWETCPDSNAPVYLGRATVDAPMSRIGDELGGGYLGRNREIIAALMLQTTVESVVLTMLTYA